jgi:sulfite reductase (NADPH) hemoprotein beta-component
MKVLTANRLHDGAVVYRKPDQSWVRTIAEAKILDSDAELALVEAQADVTGAKIVGLELIDVVQTDKGLQPVSLRERIRAFGPTV